MATARAEHPAGCQRIWTPAQSLAQDRTVGIKRRLISAPEPSIRVSFSGVPVDYRPFVPRTLAMTAAIRLD